MVHKVAQHCIIVQNNAYQVSGLCVGSLVHAGISIQRQSVLGNTAPLAQ